MCLKFSKNMIKSKINESNKRMFEKYNVVNESKNNIV